jgi:hypothetical protein
MQRFTLLAFVLLVCSLSMWAAAQENRVILVGVPVMKNAAARSVPANLERDRLVAALNQQKPDKKTHIKVEGVALEGTSADEVAEEAKQKKCAYVVYTTLVELRTDSDPNQIRPGTIQTNPGGVWTTPNSPQARGNDPEYSATVEYKLYRTGDLTPIAGDPFTNQQAMPDDAVVGQLMDRIASRVFSEVKKAPPPMQE